MSTAAPGTTPTGLDAPRPSASVEDREMLAVAAALNRELARPDPWIYWTDLLTTALVAYGSFAAALLLPWGTLGVLSALVGMLAFYRGMSFIHELTHVRDGSLPGFRTAWNALFGVPLLVPSFMYDDVHTLHHARTSYGTGRDPEYLPLASMGPRAVVVFVLVSALAPIGLLLRFAVLSPLGLGQRRIRRLVEQRFSALAINPAFRRRAPSPALRRQWIVLETAACLWALLMVGLAATGIATPEGLALGLAVGSGVALINQVRTLASHLWENEGGLPLTLTEQYLDSVNVPPPAVLPALWAPVGLRYHGLHHLLPSIPYHNLGAAHRRIGERLGLISSFHQGNHYGLWAVLGRLKRPSRRADR